MAVVSLPCPSLGQPSARPFRVGVVAGGGHVADAVRQGLTELGHREGQTFVIVQRDVAGSFERVPAAAESLVRVPVDVIVVGGSEFVQAVKNATQTIPVVFTSVGDPVEQGFVESYRKPGGNITGITNMVSDLTAKWLELLKELQPAITRVAVLWNPPQPAHHGLLKALQAAAGALRIDVRPVAVQSGDELSAAFAAVRRERVGGLTMLGSLVHFRALRQIAEFAQQASLPAVSWTNVFTEVGGLLSYGVPEGEQYRRAAIYVDRIMKGARPADLPVERPTTFALAVNLATANALGLTIPQSILVRASQIVR
jgi:putative ABC transport system substrate-binding protein